MTGPYTAKVYLNRPRLTPALNPDLALTWEKDRDALEAGTSICYRYYNSGLGATLLGTLRAATMYVGSLLQPGEHAYIRVTGRIAGRGLDDVDTGYDSTIERHASGKVFSTLGSRWSHNRLIQGL